MKSAFDKQRAAARESLEWMKRAHPEIFPQWQRLQQLKRERVNLDLEIEAAKREWDSL
jgi:hypothetical protein